MKFFRYHFFIIGLLLLSGSLLFSTPVRAETLGQRLSGRILLQVESHGEAWYVNPDNVKRYYLGRPSDALELMRQLSLGISEAEFASWNRGAPAWARGGLFLRPESHGEAYYVDLSQRWHYLGRPDDAWQLLRNQGLGITNVDLDKIPSASVLAVAPPLVQTPAEVVVSSDYSSTLTWRYQQENYQRQLNLSRQLNKDYAESLKVFYYNNEADIASVRESFYSLFLKPKAGDTLVADLVSYGRQIGAEQGWGSDQIAEFLLALVQYIPYDESKLLQSPIVPNYPYETIYKNSGVCSDKTFLAVSLLRGLGYGVAILDFPEENHSAVGISCPIADSLAGSGYCFVETTNYFPLGVVPIGISSGQAVGGDEGIGALFTADHLGSLEIYQKTEGAIYEGVAATKEKARVLKEQYSLLIAQKKELEVLANALSAKQESLNASRLQLDAYLTAGDLDSYNAAVVAYNQAATSYNTELESYRQEQKEYNDLALLYNQEITDFYQK